MVVLLLISSEATPHIPPDVRPSNIFRHTLDHVPALPSHALKPDIEGDMAINPMFPTAYDKAERPSVGES
jgi:hypothetical protein